MTRPGSARLHRRREKTWEDPNDVLLEARRLLEKRRKSGGTEERPAKAPRSRIEARMSGNSNLLFGLIAGLCIIVGLAPVRIRPVTPSANEQDHWVVQGPCLPGQTLETEDEFETARR